MWTYRSPQGHHPFLKDQLIVRGARSLHLPRRSAALVSHVKIGARSSIQDHV